MILEKTRRRTSIGAEADWTQKDDWVQPSPYVGRRIEQELRREKALGSNTSKIDGSVVRTRDFNFLAYP
jgi:hypothetical protein